MVIYVDDVLIYGKSASEIDALIEDLKKDDISLHKEGTAEGYLGVDITRNGGTITWMARHSYTLKFMRIMLVLWPLANWNREGWPHGQTLCYKYHWFREHIGPRRIELVKIDTDDQLGDLFTKGLTKIKFSQLGKKLMGW